MSAIRQAKKMGIKYLFIDAISIDQALRGDQLLQQIVAFSALYKTIPVIAAYDKRGDDFWETMRRPWILHEARSFRCNLTRIVYVGHNLQGTVLVRGKDVKMRGGGIRSEFERMLDRVWKSSGSRCALWEY